MAGPIARLMTRRRHRRVAERLAGCVLHAARRPVLYLSGWSPDTFDGRRAQHALHGALMLRRLKGLDASSGRMLAERLGEALAAAIDVAYREDGVGDASIARKVRAATSELYGLAQALDTALGAGTPAAVESVLGRNGLGGDDPAGLAAYTLQADRALAALADEAIARGDIDWPQFHI